MTTEMQRAAWSRRFFESSEPSWWFKLINGDRDRWDIASVKYSNMTLPDSQTLIDLLKSAKPRALYLVNTNASDELLAKLTTVDSLDFFTIVDNPTVSRAAIDRFKMKKPNCSVKYVDSRSGAWE